MSMDTPAPPDAALVRDFLNSMAWWDDRETWRTPGDLEAWFAANSSLSIRGLGDADLILARRLREGLREVLLSHAGHDPLPAVLGDLELVLGEIPMRMNVGVSGELELVPVESQLAAGLGSILAAIDTMRSDGTWHQLKACSRDGCRWVYWDDSRNQSSRWCSMSVCGNYIKMRRRNNPGEALADALPERGTRPREATVVDVAARAGVSIRTVESVIADATSVALPTRELVQAAIDFLSFRPNPKARALRPGHPRQQEAPVA
jgi:predicted RNA-binding Zn ribbon-like protein